MCGMVVDWLKQSACNAESMGLSLVGDSYCLWTLSKFFAHNCSSLPRDACAPLSFASLRKKGYIKDQLYCIEWMGGLVN